jgi:hypothetical protein
MKVQNTGARIIIVDDIAIKPGYPVDIDIDVLAKKHKSIQDKLDAGILVKLSDNEAKKATKNIDKAIKEKVKESTEK